MAEIPPYKHAIAPYGATMAGFPSQIAYGSWQKISHAMVSSWLLFNNTRYYTTIILIECHNTFQITINFLSHNITR